MANFRNSRYTLFFIFLFVTVYASPVNQRCIINLTSEKGTKIALNAEIADSEEAREKGLMFRESLGESEGMLFVFNKEQKLNFWMKNTLIPLDIAYIDKNGIIKEIYHMKPLDASFTYNSTNTVMFALEVNLGWFGRHKIKTGSKIEFNGCISKQNSIIKR